MKTDLPQMILMYNYINADYDVTLLSNLTGLCFNCKTNLYYVKKGQCSGSQLDTDTGTNQIAAKI